MAKAIPTQPRTLDKIVWTRSYNPWVIGGSTQQIIGSSIAIDLSKDLQLQSDIRLHQILAPNGRTFYVEPKSGGLVGDDLVMISDDIKIADPKFLASQLKRADRDR